MWSIKQTKELEKSLLYGFLFFSFYLIYLQYSLHLITGDKH